MIDKDMIRLLQEADDPLPVNVKLHDACYDGWVIGTAAKRDGTLRVIIEDACGRVFVHCAQQVRQR